MKTHLMPLMEALAGRHRCAHLMAFRLSGQWHYLTDDDGVVSANGQDYLPGFIQDIGDIEQTSDPRLNEIQPKLDAVDQTFVGLFLSQNWMNQPFYIDQAVWGDDDAFVGTIRLFDGLISSYTMEEEQDTISLGVTSVWADFEKVSGIKTNLASQQRHYPQCTGLRWSADADRKIPWGRAGSNPPLPGANTGGGGSGGDGGFGGPKQDPEEP